MNRTLATLSLLCVSSLALVGELKPEALEQTANPARLRAGIERHAATLAEYLKDEQMFGDNLGKDKIKAKAGGIAALAEALAEQATDGKAKITAAFVREASQKISSAESYADARTGLSEVQTALSGKVLGYDVEPREEWSEVVTMENLMEELNFLHNDLRRTVRRSSDPEADSLDATTAALLGLILQQNLDYAFDDEAEKEWNKFAGQLHEHYRGVAEAMRAKDTDAARDHHAKAKEFCSACHDKFREQ